MGQVWRAYDLKLRLDVALKSLHASLAGGEDGLELLRGEVRSAREVISPNVCRLFDLIEVNGHEMVSMEYIDGQTLLELLKERGPLELQEAREIGAQLLSGLEAIHQAGLVHRDIKPENVMRTRSGRVVVMDFGLTSHTGGGALGGTPAYMAPEQGRDEATDARADVFSAGMVLAEMLSAERGPDEASRQSFWENVRRDPPRLPETPWTRVLLAAVAADREHRYASAAELARRLEEITVRVEGAEKQTPYPGLASFTREGAEFFFGREAEVEAAWKKLQQSYLLGLVGTSGAGKTSFIEAGLLPAAPDGWSHVSITPGKEPFEALTRALLPELQDEADTVEGLISLDDPEAAIAALRRWRERHLEALLVVDQFEELFTLNPPAVQGRFASLLGRAALEGDLHVLLSMRDDFLLRCYDFASLASLFSELTPLKAPMGSALRRALTQPALRLGYRFEDEGMVEEMLAEVTKERGALPLIAFTAARLWEERDPDEGLLTRAAYERIGGVGGALAQHAEATLEEIGRDREHIVRELFRNLVTAQGTRAVVDVDEILSVFGSDPDDSDRQAARGVLRSLIDARLLTSYEVSEASSGKEASRRSVEVVHESLLSAWPRLVRWRTQDAEGAQLRDELRQAARLWDTRGRSDDLLWTGTAFREFQVWRERYPGRLTALEEEFARAMGNRAERRQRRRRLAVVAALLIAATVAAVTGTLWRQSERARSQAVASELLALARLEQERYPTAALAFATESLEHADTQGARRLAIETLWRAPPARILPVDWAPGPCGPHVAVSPNGNWTAVASMHGEVRLFNRRGAEHRALPLPPPERPCWWRLAFGPASDVLVTSHWSERDVGLWSVPDLEPIAVIRPAGAFPVVKVRGRRLLTLSWSRSEELGQVQAWPLTGGEPELLGTWAEDSFNPWQAAAWDVDPTGGSVGYVPKGSRSVFRVPFDALDGPAPQVIGSLDGEISALAFSPEGDRLYVRDGPNERVSIWPLADLSDRTHRIVEGVSSDDSLDFAVDTRGSWLVWGSSAQRRAVLVDLAGSPAANPTSLIRHDEDRIRQAAFDPRGDWLMTAHHNSLSFWPLHGRWSRRFVVGAQLTMMGNALALSADGRTLLSCAIDGVHLLPLEPDGDRRRTVGNQCNSVAPHPSRPEFLFSGGDARLASLDNGAIRSLPELEWLAYKAVAMDPTRGLGVMGGWEQNAPLTIWSMESWEPEPLALTDLEEDRSYSVDDLRFMPDGDLVSAGEGGVMRWDLETRTHEVLQESRSASLDLSRDGRYLLATVSEELSDNVLIDTQLLLFDLDTGARHEITTHGDAVQRVAFGPAGRLVVTGDAEGVVRVGPVTGEEPHLLLGHGDQIKGLAVSPDGRWILSGAGGEILQWPMPDLSEPPLHSLPLEDLLAELRAHTNLRVERDPRSRDGWRLEIGPFSE